MEDPRFRVLVGPAVASRPNYSLPTFTESGASNVLFVEGTLQEAFTSKQADARLAARHNK